MEGKNEEAALLQASNEQLSNIRELSIPCRTLLHELSSKDGSTDTDVLEAKELMASFNVWTANMGVFRDGRQSLTSRLKSAPEISGLVQQLLVALKRDLEKMLLQQNSKEESSSNSDSDDSSDRSSISSYKKTQTFEDDPPPPRSSAWTLLRNTVTSLRQLELTVRQAGVQHRQERIQRFKNLDRNKEVYRTIERYARQKVNHLFPKASEVLRNRMAESIATRRARFLYLEQHQKKSSTLNEPAPELQRNKVTEEEGKGVLPRDQLGQQQATGWGSSIQPSEMLSNTVVTKLDPKRLNPGQNKPKRAESVSSVQISTGTFPSIPQLDPGGASFTCPCCFLVCPATEVDGESQWRSHLIHDFEPFFCIFDDCATPFTCADTYGGWLIHMRDTHTQPEWHCWHCRTASSSGPFSTQGELESHLEKQHHEEITDSLRPTLVKHGMIRSQHALSDCPFCAGFPQEIERVYPDRDCKDAREALVKHVRDHLVSVALILAPTQTGEPDSNLSDIRSEAQRDSYGELELDGVEGTYQLECRDDPCNCKGSNNPDDDWFTSPEYDKSLVIEDMEAVSSITRLWERIFRDNTLYKSDGKEDRTLKSFTANFRRNQALLAERPRPLVEVSDIRRERRTEADYRDDLTDYIVFRFEKVLSEDGYSSDGDKIEASWEYCLRTRVTDISKKVAVREIRNLNKHSDSLADKKQSLNPAQQRQLEKALQELSVQDNDDRFEWSLVQIDHQLQPVNIPEKESREKNQKTKKYQRISITAYYKRAPLTTIDAQELARDVQLVSIHRFTAIEQQLQRQLELEKEQQEAQDLEAALRVLGEDHPDTATHMAKLARIYKSQGRWEDAEKLLVRVIEMCREKPGAEHPDILTSMMNLASIYGNQGRWNEAETLELQVLEARKTTLGDINFETLKSMTNLASIYCNQRQWDKAKELGRHVLETCKTRFGDKHPDTSISMANLASICRGQGRWHEAEELERQASEARNAILEAGHHDTVPRTANLPSIYIDHGRWDKEEEYEDMSAKSSQDDTEE